MPAKSKTPKRSQGAAGFSRRGFVQFCGVGTLAMAMGNYSGGVWNAEDGADRVFPADDSLPLRLEVNGRSRELLVEPRWSLLFVLRERLGLTAAKPGRERGECGACTVLVDDRPRYACLTLALEAAGRRIETAEGLMDGEHLGPVQRAFLQEDGLQCGYCTPGQVMAAEGLLRRNGQPTIEEIRREMSGNLCRCGAYAHIFNAVAEAAKTRES